MGVTVLLPVVGGRGALRALSTTGEGIAVRELRSSRVKASQSHNGGGPSSGGERARRRIIRLTGIRE